MIPWTHSIWNVHGIHPPKVWNPSGKSMESIRKVMESMWKVMESMWKVHGIHQESHGIHVEKVWNPYGKTMESIPHSMESIHQKYGIHPSFHGIHPPFHGIHPPFHGIHLEFLQSTPHSMDSIWINPGRVKYWDEVTFMNGLIPSSFTIMTIGFTAKKQSLSSSYLL